MARALTAFEGARAEPGATIRSQGQAAASAQRTKLPKLRPELIIEPHVRDPAGAETWLIEDPVRHRFIRIDAATHSLIALLGDASDLETLIERAKASIGPTVTEADIERLLLFLFSHELTAEPPSGGWRRLADKAAQASQMTATKLAHRYLFFRVPLFRPQRFLLATLPLVEPLFTRAFAAATLLAGLIGLYFVSRQWDAFIGTFADLATWLGAAAFAVSLVAVKAAHELGHAYTAVRKGAVVPTIGIAFMLLTPLPYTDVSDTWRFRRRRDRFAVDAAGVTVELAIACYATLLWAFLPDGSAKSVAFLLATASWMMSVAINLNPLMRFDGYYLLSEALGMENLQPRAFAIGRWRLREALFGLGAHPPEPLPRGRLVALALYAYAVWLYRLVLFIGIALLVYHLTFKVLGVILFVIEIVFLVAKPIAGEMKEWLKLRKEIARSRRLPITIAAFSSLVLLFVVPWSTTIEVPAILAHEARTPIHAPVAGQVERVFVTDGEAVTRGQTLIELSSPDLDHRIAVARNKLDLIDIRIARIAGDPVARREITVLHHERQRLADEIAGLVTERAELVLKSPASGRARDVDRDVRPGVWVAPSRRLAVVSGASGVEARGYLDADARERVEIGNPGLFIGEDPLARPVPVKLVSVSVSGVETLAHMSLISEFGGPISATRVHEGQGRAEGWKPLRGQYLVTFAVDEQVQSEVWTERRGTIHLTGRAESLAARTWRQVLSVLAREAGA